MTTEIIKEGANFIYKDGVPVAVIVQNGLIRTPQVLTLEQASADKIAELFGSVKKPTA